MNCNGTRPNIFVAVYLMIVLLQFATAHQAPKKHNGKPKEEGLNGDLYDLFKKRLNNFQNELSIGVNNFVEEKQSEAKPLQGIKKPFKISDGLYEKFKIRLDKFTNEINSDGKSMVDNTLYEEFRRRLDKFSNELSVDARKVFEAVTADKLKKKNKLEKRSASNDDCMYDLYKSQWAKIYDALALDSDKGFDRCGRSFDDILNVLGLNKLQPKTIIAESSEDDELRKLIPPNTVEEPPIKNEPKQVAIPNIMEQRPIRIELKKLSLKEIIDAAKELNNADVRVELISEDERLNLKKALKKFLYDDYQKQLDKITEAFSKSKSWSMGRRNGRDMVRIAPDENVLMPADFNKIQFSRHSPKGSVLNNVVSSNLNPLVDFNYGQLNPIEFQTDKHYSKNVNCRHTSSTTTNEKLHKKVNREAKIDRSLPPYTTDSPAAYPSVLVKALEASLNPKTGTTSGDSLLSSVAKEMNTTPLELARQLTSTKDVDWDAVKNDPKLSKLLDHFKDTSKTGKTADAQAIERKPKHSNPSNTEDASVVGSPALGSYCNGDEPEPDSSQDCDEPAPENVSTVLEKVLCKLEHMQKSSCKPGEEVPDKIVKPDGTPCSIVGSWNSKVLGLRFQISTSKGSRALSPAEGKNKLLSIETQECVPAKRHTVMDTDWVFMGSAIRQIGGPFYIYAQKSEENVLATFAGFCRYCGGTDTIFGSWTFLFPSKDCQDISTSIENKRDILRRDNMDSKRTARYKDYLYQKTHRAKTPGKCGDKCCMSNANKKL